MEKLGDHGLEMYPSVVLGLQPGPRRVIPPNMARDKARQVEEVKLPFSSLGPGMARNGHRRVSLDGAAMFTAFTGPRLEVKDSLSPQGVSFCKPRVCNARRFDWATSLPFLEA